VILGAAAAVAALASCGGGGDAEPAPPAAEPTPAAERPVAAPEVAYDLRRDPGAWPALAGGVLELDAGPATLVPAPRPAPPPVRVEAELELPERGRAGVFCGDYGLAVGADGGYAIYRLAEREAPEPLLDGRLDASGRSDPGEPTLVRLVCGGEAVGFQINASPLSYAKTAAGAATRDPSGTVGAFGVGPSGERARFLAFGIGGAPQPRG